MHAHTMVQIFKSIFVLYLCILINFFKIETELLDKVNKYFQLTTYIFQKYFPIFLKFLVKYIQNEFKKENEKRN